MPAPITATDRASRRASTSAARALESPVRTAVRCVESITARSSPVCPLHRQKYTADSGLLLRKLGVHLDGVGGNVCRSAREEYSFGPGPGQRGTYASRAHHDRANSRGTRYADRRAA